MSRSKPTSSCCWIFTLFTKGSQDPPDVNIPRSWPGVTFGVWQLEKGLQTRKLFLKGYIRTEKPVDLKALKSFHPTAHWEERRNPHQSAVLFCTKQQNRVEGPFYIGFMDRYVRPQSSAPLKRKIDETTYDRKRYCYSRNSEFNGAVGPWDSSSQAAYVPPPSSPGSPVF